MQYMLLVFKDYIQIVLSLKIIQTNSNISITYHKVVTFVSKALLFLSK